MSFGGFDDSEDSDDSEVSEEDLKLAVECTARIYVNNQIRNEGLRGAMKLMLQYSGKNTMPLKIHDDERARGGSNLLGEP